MLKTYLPQILILFGLGLTFVGGLISFIRSNEYDKKIEKNVDETIQLSKENQRLAQSNEQLNNQNQLLIQKNLELSNLINSNITGGDSFCYVTISFDSPTTGQIITHNPGKYALSSIQVRITDLSELNGSTPVTIESLSKNTFTISELPPNTVSVGGKITIINGSKHVRLNVFCNARNGDFTQLLRLRWDGDVWSFATRVMEMR